MGNEKDEGGKLLLIVLTVITAGGFLMAVIGVLPFEITEKIGSIGVRVTAVGLLGIMISYAYYSSITKR